MPTPVAHSLLGAALHILRLPRCTGWRALGRVLSASLGAWLLAVVLANLPDVDYVAGIFQGYLNSRHHYLTHSLGWITLVSAGIWLCRFAWAGRRDLAPALFVWLLLASHLAADYFTQDGLAPYGIMVFWPFSDAFFAAGHPLFPKVEKLSFGDLLTAHNAWVLLGEAAICLPVLLVAAGFKCRGLPRQGK